MRRSQAQDSAIQYPSLSCLTLPYSVILFPPFTVLLFFYLFFVSTFICLFFPLSKINSYTYWSRLCCHSCCRATVACGPTLRRSWTFLWSSSRLTMEPSILVDCPSSLLGWWAHYVPPAGMRTSRNLRRSLIFCLCLSKLTDKREIIISTGCSGPDLILRFCNFILIHYSAEVSLFTGKVILEIDHKWATLTSKVTPWGIITNLQLLRDFFSVRIFFLFSLSPSTVFISLFFVF